MIGREDAGALPVGDLTPAIQLDRAQPQHKIRGPTVTQEAFGSSWYAPRLSGSNLPCFTRRRNQCRVGLFVVPAVAIASPFVFLAQQHACFDAPSFQTKRLHAGRAVRKIPSALVGDFHASLARQRDQSLADRTIMPCRSVHLIGQEPRLWL